MVGNNFFPWHKFSQVDEHVEKGSEIPGSSLVVLDFWQIRELAEFSFLTGRMTNKEMSQGLELRDSF